MRTLLLTFAATLLCAGAYAADPELYCADLTYDGFTTRSYTFATRGDRTLVLEIDLPERGDASGPRPFVVYVPGGSWRTCGIGAFRRQSAYLASQGIAGVRIVYSLVGDGADFSAGLEELQAARDLVAARAGELGLDTLRFGYVAASAGTPLAADEALSQAGCRFFVGYNGIYDLTRRIDGSRFPEEGTPYLAPFSDGELRDFSPVNRIGADPPAVALFHGRADRTISWKQSQLFCDAVRAAGGGARTGLYRQPHRTDVPRSFSTTTPATASSITGSPTTTRRSPARRRRSSSPCWASRRGVSGWRMVERACGFRKPFSSSVREGYSSGLSPLFFAARWRMTSTMRL